jgi:hypothetical protein
MMEMELVAMAVDINEGQRFITALLSLDDEAVARFAEKQGIELDGPATEDFALHSIL